MDNFLTFYSSTNPAVHHEASLGSFFVVKQLNSSLTKVSEPNNQINFKIRNNFFSTFLALFFHFDGLHSPK
jgi:hypothetical protein